MTRHDTNKSAEFKESQSSMATTSLQLHEHYFWLKSANTDICGDIQ